MWLKYEMLTEAVMFLASFSPCFCFYFKVAISFLNTFEKQVQDLPHGWVCLICRWASTWPHLSSDGIASVLWRREEIILWKCALAARMKKSPCWEVLTPNKTPSAEMLSCLSSLPFAPTHTNAHTLVTLFIHACIHAKTRAKDVQIDR